MFDGLPLPVELTLRTLVVVALAGMLAVLAGWLDRVAVPLILDALPDRLGVPHGSADRSQSASVVTASATLVRGSRRALTTRPAAPLTQQPSGLGPALPAIGLAAAVIALAVLPFGPGLTALEVSASVLVVLVATVVITVIPAIAPVTPGSAAVLPTRRARATMGLTSSLLLLAVALLPTLMVAASLSLSEVAEAWQWWWLAVGLPGLLIFVFAVVDLLGAASGPGPAVRGWPRVVMLTTRYLLIAALAVLAATVFLGGWSGPWSDTVGLLWSVVKIAAVLVLLLAADQAADRWAADPDAGAHRWLDRCRGAAIPLAATGALLTAAGVVVFG